MTKISIKKIKNNIFLYKTIQKIITFNLNYNTKNKFIKNNIFFQFFSFKSVLFSFSADIKASSLSGLLVNFIDFFSSKIFFFFLADKGDFEGLFEAYFIIWIPGDKSYKLLNVDLKFKSI